MFFIFSLNALGACGADLLNHFEKNSLIRYLDNFNEIYQEYDRLIDHEIDFGKFSYLKKKKFKNFKFHFEIISDEKHLIIDCHINCEDVTLGLALQTYTPFRFHSRKIWCSYGFLESEYSFKNYDLIQLINPNVSLYLKT